MKTGGASEEAIRAALGTEEPVKAEAVSGEIPTLDDLPATPDFAAKLLEEDKAFDAVLDLDYQEAAVQAQRRLSKNVAELDAIPAIEYSENMFPEGQDLQVRGLGLEGGAGAGSGGGGFCGRAGPGGGGLRGVQGQDLEVEGSRGYKGRAWR